MGCPPNDHFKNITYDHLEFTRLAIAARLAYFTEFNWNIKIDACHYWFIVICRSGGFTAKGRFDAFDDWNKPEIIERFCCDVIRSANKRIEDPVWFEDRLPIRV